MKNSRGLIAGLKQHSLRFSSTQAGTLQEVSPPEAAAFCGKSGRQGAGQDLHAYSDDGVVPHYHGPGDYFLAPSWAHLLSQKTAGQVFFVPWDKLEAA